MLPIAVATSVVKTPSNNPQRENDDVDEFFDAPDHFSDDDFSDDFSDDDFDDEQAPDDPITDKTIRFHQLAVWNNSEANEVEYILPPNYGKHGN